MATNEKKRPRVYRIYSDNAQLTDTEQDVSALKLKMNSIAEPFAVTESYSAGEYVWYNNVLYVFTTDHAAGSWTGSDAEQVVLTEEMTDQITELKTDFTEFEDTHTTESSNLWSLDNKWVFGSINASGADEPTSQYIIRTDKMPVEPNTTYAFYDGRDWTKAQYNILYPAQFVYEYKADGTYIKNTAIYIQQFTTSENTGYIRFRSNAMGATFDINTFNTKGFVLEKGSAYRGYTSPVSKNIVSDYPFYGSKSDNLFEGGMYGFVNSSNGSVSVIVTSANASTSWIKASSTRYSKLYWVVANYSASYQITQGLFFDANKKFLSYAGGTAISNTVFGVIYSITIPENTEYVILRAPEVTGSDASLQAAEELKEACEKGLIVSDSIEVIYANHAINGSAKVSGADTNVGFLQEVRNSNIRDFMMDGLKTYTDGILSSSYDATITAMTDLHSWSYEPYAVINYMADSGAVDMAINLGDTIPDKFTVKADAEDFLIDRFRIQNNFTTKRPIYNAIGNHDVNPTNNENIPDGSKMIQLAELYSLTMGRVSDGIISGKCYGYYDIENAKIRVVILNSSDIYNSSGTPLISGLNTAVQEEQFEWFCNEALDFTDKADASEWAVITMAHDRLSTVGGTGDPFATVITAFTTGTTATASGSRTVDGHTFSLSANVDYTGQGAVEYIGHICGHAHDDAIYTFATNYKEVQIACAVLAAHYYVNGTRETYTRTRGTVEELLFDTICINRKTHTVDLKRFGVGTDRQFTY